MPLHWYLTLLLVAGSCGLIDQLLRGRFTRRGFAVATALAAVGTLLGWAMGYGMDLPELVPLTVGGRAFPLFWSVLGAAMFLGSLDLIERRNRRRVRA
jgi:uncharacterized membrane protein YeaQ/YmgE (transglycosylase-associated protein family)